jgi:hypothetical protein
MHWFSMNSPTSCRGQGQFDGERMRGMGTHLVQQSGVRAGLSTVDVVLQE